MPKTIRVVLGVRTVIARPIASEQPAAAISAGRRIPTAQGGPGG
jgi:hypothetical protein